MRARQCGGCSQGVPFALAVAQAEDGTGRVRPRAERRCGASVCPAPAGVRLPAQHLLPGAFGRRSVLRPDHAVREDGHSLPVLSARRGQLSLP